MLASVSLQMPVSPWKWAFDGVLLNSAIALADNPVLMAKAFASAISAGESAYIAGTMPERQTAHASTPTLDSPFWHNPEHNQ